MFVLIVTLLILPTLAYLQYKWIGQLSEQEYKRMKENIRRTAFHCSMEFSKQMMDMIKSVNNYLNGANLTMQPELTKRIEQLKTKIDNPELIKEKTYISLVPSADKSVSMKINQPSSIIFLLNDLSAFAIPLRNKPKFALFITLDKEYLISTLIPKIINNNFIFNDELEYDIIITTSDDQIFYHTGDKVQSDVLKQPDVVIPFLSFPPSSFVLFSTEQWMQNDPLRGRNDRSLSYNRIPTETDNEREMPPPEDREFQDREPRSSRLGILKLCLRHKNISLENVVRINRLRNLGISFSVLLLLGISIVFLLASANRAQRLAQQKLEFVACISHELRTPIAVLKSAADNLSDGVIVGENRTRKYGELIKTEVIRLSEMVEKVLAYAGIQSGKQNYELRPLGIESIINAAIENTKKLLPLDDIVVETSIEHNIPQVLGDATALQSALENLIINGIKYSPDEKWIRIEARQVNDSSMSFVEIKVIDHGIGIAASDISNIFEPFYRGRNAIDEQIQGSGLGLSITKHIIASHGGRISVKSSPKEGSVFTILLPSMTQDKENK